MLIATQFHNISCKMGNNQLRMAHPTEDMRQPPNTRSDRNRPSFHPISYEILACNTSRPTEMERYLWRRCRCRVRQLTCRPCPCLPCRRRRRRQRSRPPACPSPWRPSASSPSPSVQVQLHKVDRIGQAKTLLPSKIWLRYDDRRRRRRREDDEDIWTGRTRALM